MVLDDVQLDKATTTVTLPDRSQITSIQNADYYNTEYYKTETIIRHRKINFMIKLRHRGGDSLGMS